LRFLDERSTPVLEIDDVLLRDLFARARCALPNETGGILIGEYDGARVTAIVRSVTGPPRDSSATPTTFRRGTRGLNRLLRCAWRKRLYYIGEWHFHPEERPRASFPDTLQMRELACSEQMQCPEPLLLIVGHPDFGCHVAAYRFRGVLEKFQPAPPYRMS
jgi:integrative and conjugative element protein (TIGR02256 family)